MICIAFKRCFYSTRSPRGPGAFLLAPDQQDEHQSHSAEPERQATAQGHGIRLHCSYSVEPCLAAPVSYPATEFRYITLHARWATVFPLGQMLNPDLTRLRRLGRTWRYVDIRPTTPYIYFIAFQRCSVRKRPPSLGGFCLAPDHQDNDKPEQTPRPWTFVRRRPIRLALT